MPGRLLPHQPASGRAKATTLMMVALLWCSCVTPPPFYTVTAFTSNLGGVNNGPNAFGQTQRVVSRPKKVTPAAKQKKKSSSTATLPTPSPDDPTVVAFIRSEYDAWVMQHNKTVDEDRFEIFKQNFLSTLETFETTGKYHALNKFADLTPDEYKLEKKQEEAEMDAYVRSEYKAWREQYNKPPNDEARYQVFKTNFLMTMKIFEESGKFNALNEHGDMTREEYLKMQTHLAISSSRREGSGGGGADWSSNSYRDPGMMMQQPQSEAATYQRSESMTFQPVTPRSTSDVLNSRGTSGTEYDVAYGIGSGGGGRESVDNSWGGGGAGGGNSWGGGGMGGAPSYAPPPTYAPAQSAPAPSFQRTDAMTFAPVSPRSTSDVLNTGGNSGGSGGGGGLGSEWDIAYGRTSGGGGGGAGGPAGGRPDWNQAAFSNGGGGNSFGGGGGDPYGGGGRGGNSWGGGQESVAPMVGPPSNYPSSQSNDPYGGGGGGGNSYQYERPSEMTFTPVTPKSSSDVLNNGRGGGGGGSSDWDIAYGYGDRRGGSSGALGATASWSPPTGSATQPPPVQPPQPYTPTNPPGASFVPITPNSGSDMRNRRRDRPNDSSSSGTFSYIPKAPGSPNEARNGINSFMGRSNNNGGGGGTTNNNNNNKNSIWNKMASEVASAVDSLVGGSKPNSSWNDRLEDDDDSFAYLKRNSRPPPGGGGGYDSGPYV